MTRVYVSGSSLETSRARKAMRAVEEVGWLVTHDWVTSIGEGFHTEAEEIAMASADLHGVDTADVVWFLIPETVSIGAWVELGYAKALGIPVVATGKLSGMSIWHGLIDKRLDHDETGIRGIATVLHVDGNKIAEPSVIDSTPDPPAQETLDSTPDPPAQETHYRFRECLTYVRRKYGKRESHVQALRSLLVERRVIQNNPEFFFLPFPEDYLYENKDAVELLDLLWYEFGEGPYLESW